jgi:hypothetical protein
MTIEYKDLMLELDKIRVAAARLASEQEDIQWDRSDIEEETVVRLYLRSTLDHLVTVSRELEWLNKKVVATGKIVKNHKGEYEIHGYVLAPGMPIEILIYPEDENRPYYALTQISSGPERFAFLLGSDKSLEGVEARLRM